jgi:tripartite-type tricarboxylate transporter receptor subunit TctC
MTKKLTASCLAAMFVVAATAAFGAERYPSKPVRLIVPFAPGGNVDIVTRVIARKLTENLGQQVVVDNRGGAGGVIGTELAARAPSDGYTLLMVTASHVTNPGLRKLPYDTEKDFAAIAIVVDVPVILVVHPSLPVRTVPELVALAKAKPGQLNYGSGGNGTGAHLAAELLKSAAAVNLVHIPYKGIGLALVDLLGGQIQMMFSAMPSVMPHVRQGRLRALGVAAAQRSPALPDVPTIRETGIPGVEASVSFTLLAPAATPKKIIEHLNSEIVKALHAPEIKERLVSEGAMPVGSSPDEARRFLAGEIARWGKVTKALGLRPD